MSLTNRVKALEEVVKPNSITLTDPKNPNCKVHIELCDGEFTIKKSETKVTDFTDIVTVDLTE